MDRNSRSGRLTVASVLLSIGAFPAWAADPATELKELRQELRRLERRIEELEAQQTPRARTDEEAALDDALAEIETRPAQAGEGRSIVSRPVGAARVRLIDLSLDVLASAGGSTEDDESLELLQAGGHDPRKNGFTLQGVELGAMGAVDPYLTGETHFVFLLDPDGETVVELEEAFFQTLALPYGLQLEGGHFFTEFGRLNPTHSHAWFWQDQPLIHSRIFGADGMRNPGVRLGWLLPLPWFSELHAGVQDPGGETMPSFLGGSLEHEHALEHEAGEDEDHPFGFEAGIAGRPIVDRTVRDPGDLVWLGRWVHSFDPTDEISTQLGGSFLAGRNTTGEDARTRVYGADVVVKVRPRKNFRGWPFFVLESELVARDFEAEAFADPEEPGRLLFPRDTLRDYGLYAQGVLGFTYGWGAGLRFEAATGDGASAGGRGNDPFRDDRFRLSPLLLWQPTEFSRFRLQYNYDEADHLPDGAHSVWLGAEFLYGAHPAHGY